MSDLSGYDIIYGTDPDDRNGIIVSGAPVTCPAACRFDIREINREEAIRLLRALARHIEDSGLVVGVGRDAAGQQYFIVDRGEGRRQEIATLGEMGAPIKLGIVEDSGRA